MGDNIEILNEFDKLIIQTSQLTQKLIAFKTLPELKRFTYSKTLEFIISAADHIESNLKSLRQQYLHKIDR